MCDHTTGCEAYTFTTEGYGMKGGRAQTSLHKSGLREIVKLSPTLPRQGIEPRVFGFKIRHANSTCPPIKEFMSRGVCDQVNNYVVFFQTRSARERMRFTHNQVSSEIVIALLYITVRLLSFCYI